MARLSKRTVDALQPGAKDYFEWDTELPLFGVRVSPKGTKSYVVQYRDDGGHTRRKRLGRHGVVTAEDARKEAREHLASVARGGNPSVEARARRMAPTVDALCDRFMTEYVPSHCKPSTEAEYRRNIDLFILPALQHLRVADVTRADVADLHHAHRKIPYQANRTLGVLSVMFNQAEIWGLRPEGTNPCRHVRKFEEKKRERYLSREELAALGQALNDLEAAGTESLSAINAVRLLILTGCRLGEIQTLRWDYIQGYKLMLPDSKTGAKSVYLGPDALDVLSKIERLPDNPYVITGKLPGSHLTDMQKPWRRIRKAAGLEDVRIHDLRHSFASAAVGMGVGLPMIGKLLGHTQVQTTARYAHLADDPVQSAADLISGEIASLLKPKPANDARS